MKNERYPHQCDSCGSACYNSGFSVKCSNGECRHAEHPGLLPQVPGTMVQVPRGFEVQRVMSYGALPPGTDVHIPEYKSVTQSLKELGEALQAGRYNAAPSKLRQGSHHLYRHGRPLMGQDLEDALDSAALVPGQPLQVESLAPTMQAVKFNQERLQLGLPPVSEDRYSDMMDAMEYAFLGRLKSDLERQFVGMPSTEEMKRRAMRAIEHQLGDIGCGLVDGKIEVKGTTISFRGSILLPQHRGVLIDNLEDGQRAYIAHQGYVDDRVVIAMAKDAGVEMAAVQLDTADNCDESEGDGPLNECPSCGSTWCQPGCSYKANNPCDDGPTDDEAF